MRRRFDVGDRDHRRLRRRLARPRPLGLLRRDDRALPGAAMSRRLNLPPSTTLAEAEAVMRPLVWEAEGVICPLCRQHAQVYKWSLYSTAAHALILLLKLGGRDKPIHTKEIKKLGHTG